MSDFRASAVIFHCKKYSPDRRSVGGGDNREVTALDAFAGPAAFRKKLDYLVRISLEGRCIGSVCKIISPQFSFLIKYSK